MSRDRHTILGNVAKNSGSGTAYLTESLATLENLKVLKLDLHYLRNVNQTLGPSGVLNLARLPNLQSLAVPFQFLLSRANQDHFEFNSPECVLPPGLRTLTILACHLCVAGHIGVAEHVMGAAPVVATWTRVLDSWTRSQIYAPSYSPGSRGSATWKVSPPTQACSTSRRPLIYSGWKMFLGL
jgi:hypothetical protein